MTGGLRIAHLGIAPQWAILRWAILRVVQCCPLLFIVVHIVMELYTHLHDHIWLLWTISWYMLDPCTLSYIWWRGRHALVCIRLLIHQGCPWERFLGWTLDITGVDIFSIKLVSCSNMYFTLLKFPTLSYTSMQFLFMNEFIYYGLLILSCLGGLVQLKCQKSFRMKLLSTQPLSKCSSRAARAPMNVTMYVVCNWYIAVPHKR